MGHSWLVNYLYERAEKLAVISTITMNGIKYFFGCGIDMVDYLSKSILSEGDVSTSGQFSVVDDNGNHIFKVDPVQRTISNVYRTSIGKSIPNSALDVFDNGINDILNLIGAMAKIYNNINNNIQLLTSTNLNTIPESFLDYNHSPPTQITQTVDDYFGIILPDINHPDNSIIKYSWLYKHWANQIIGEINDPNNKAAIKAAIFNIEARTINNFIFDNFDNIGVRDWTFGKKIYIGRNTILNDGKVYSLMNGINIQSFDLRYNTNPNISNFVESISTYNKFLQYIVANINDVDTSVYPNHPLVARNLDEASYTFPLTKASVHKLQIDLKNPFLTTIQSIAFDYETNTLTYGTETPSLKDLGSTSNQGSKRFKYSNFIVRMVKSYNNQKAGDYGVLGFEDEVVDYMGLFYITNTQVDETNNKITLICIDYQINNIVFPAVDIRGDVRVNGDLLVKDINGYNKNNSNTEVKQNYFTVDPALKFVGINTDQRYITYPRSFAVDSTSSINASQEHVYISKDTNPNLCCERIGESATEIVNHVDTLIGSDPDSQTLLSQLVNDPSNKYTNFRSFSAATIRRKSNLYSVNEMYNYALANSTINNNFAKYGVEISAEITDKNDFTQFMGNFGMVIDKVDAGGNICTGFIVRAYDVDPTTHKYAQPRPIMYVDNDATLHVDNIVVGKTSPLSIATGSSTITVDQVKLTGSTHPLYVTADGNGNEVLMWGNVQLATQPPAV
jgi:hypothetical protein